MVVVEKPRSWGFIEHVISLYDSPGMVKRIFFNEHYGISSIGLTLFFTNDS